jgi:hypothetical protein
MVIQVDTTITRVNGKPVKPVKKRKKRTSKKKK